ncbi:MAG: asparagine synthase (glutamine-hydrolyzing) [Planctomycetes bacterium]|nr:asparagine synthase (glutamine-hydrolyzing) [Planctomycetota bacterium]
MCGIVGILGIDGRPVDPLELERMTDAIVHRGPDGSGTACRDNVGFGHRRLAIIDPELGAQPIFNDDESVALTYNGEVYNYVELRKELEGEFRFTTHSDTEVVLRAYEKWGIDCVQRFRGMFAFAIHDARQRVVWIVRDRAGIKPLFWYRDANRVLFASEISAILRTDGFPREVDEAALSGYFRYQYVPAPRTIYRGLRKLEPGHLLRVDLDTGDVEDREYWNLEVRTVDRDEQDWLDELAVVLDDTIRMYVRSDVPFGAFLSGGMDSSLVAALMQRHLDERVRSFTIGFREEEHSELPYARAAADSIGTEHFERVVSPDLAEATFATLAQHFGEPFGDSSAVPTFYVSQEARKHVKMVLSGDGGDELFAGYNSYQQTFRMLGENPWRSPRRLARTVDRLLPWRRRGTELDPFQADHDRQREIFPASELRALLAPSISVAPAAGFRVSPRSAFQDPLARFQAQDFKTYMVDDVLTKVDRMSMANSLEVRVPLLDHHVIELAFSLPTRMKMRENARTGQLDTKYLLRRSSQRFYSEEFLARPKRGFGIPVVEWCQGPLRPVIESGLRARDNAIFDFVDHGYVQRTLDEFFGGRDVLVARVWLLLMFDLWGRHVHGAAQAIG